MTSEGKARRTSADDTATFYDAVAADFEADYYGESADPSIRHDVASFGTILENAISGKVVQCAIELGSGSGHWLAHFQDRGVPAYGIDISAGMCAEAKTRGVVTTQADISALAVRSSCADLIVSPYCALDHCEQFENAFREIERIATADSVVVLMVDNAERFIRQYWRVCLPRVVSVRSDPRSEGYWVHEVDGEAVSVFTKMYRTEEIRRLLAGWRITVYGLGFLTPLIPHILRRRFPQLVTYVLNWLGPLERYLCSRFSRRAALLVVVGSRI